MKFYWSMPEGLKVHYRKELETYKLETSKANFTVAWRHLERAHILGQPWFVQHTQVHWLMLKFGIRIKNRKEILGQLPRLLVGGIKSFVGTIPTGNTGGANVPPLRVMEIPEELKDIMRPYRNI
ncbi:MAG: DUF3703 domain-containing protein [Chitinophagaceae bacterium]|nr:DUF3703 domain-containing protein [Chitinophagaceae bacterium]HQV87252.1 DUF3703 domain-containing protein [Chitinophagaceae bacterium]HQZ75558.1 DUF3703 domain-containing protein [Chitinophagaceae bacterium]